MTDIRTLADDRIIQLENEAARIAGGRRELTVLTAHAVLEEVGVAIVPVDHATSALVTETDRLDWLMSTVCCDEVPGISLALGMSREAHLKAFRREIDKQILKARSKEAA